MIWWILLALGVGVAAMSQPMPAIHRTRLLTRAWRYRLIVKDLDPSQPMTAETAWTAILGGFSEDGAEVVSCVVSADRTYVDCTFDWMGTTGATFTWDSSYDLQNIGTTPVGGA